MANLMLIKHSGLNTFQNEIDTAEKGDLQQATNVVIDKPDTISPRRGFELQAKITGKEIRDTYEFKNNILANTTDNQLYYRNEANEFVQLSGELKPPEAGEKVRGIEGGNAILFTSDLGIKRLEALNAPLTLAGIREAYEPVLAFRTDTNGFFTANSQVSYRVTYTYIDDNNRLHESAPSTRTTLVNDSTDESGVALLQIINPRDSYATGFRVYRTDLSVSSTALPAENFKLAFTGELTPETEILFHLDNVPQLELGAVLYTNADILLANTPPPKAKVLAEFQGRTVYGDIQTRETLTIEKAIEADSITISGLLFTKASEENIDARQYNDIESLLKQVNLQDGVRIDAYDAEGILILRARDFSGVFGVILKTGDVNEEFTSTSDRFLHGFAYSLPDQPESVPTLNYETVGRQDARILAMIENNGSLWIFKEDGFFIYSGTSIALVDSSLILEAPDSVKVLNNLIYAVTNQGLIVGVSDQKGVDIGYRIKDLVETGKINNKELYAKTTFAVTHPNEKKYILFVKKGFSYIQLVYNYETDAWTSWDFDANVAIYDRKNDALIFSKGESVYSQKNNGGIEDYSDEDKTYKTIVQTNPITANQVGFLKHFKEGLFLWNKREFAKGRLTFVSDISATPEYIEVVGERSAGWGNEPWGPFPWGGAEQEEKSDAFIPPKNMEKCSRLTMGFEVDIEGDYFEFNGLSLNYDIISQTVRH